MTPPCFFVSIITDFRLKSTNYFFIGERTRQLTKETFLRSHLSVLVGTDLDWRMSLFRRPVS
jgi:hypothetical protein